MIRISTLRVGLYENNLVAAPTGEARQMPVLPTVGPAPCGMRPRLDQVGAVSVFRSCRQSAVNAAHSTYPAASRVFRNAFDATASRMLLHVLGRPFRRSA